jgi:hypothetical protein
MYSHARHRRQVRHIVPGGFALAVFCTVLSVFSAGCAAFVTTTSPTGSISQTSTPPPNQTAAPLSITQQPANQTISQSHAATFAVAATGPSPLQYQWQKNGSPVSGATQASYTTPLAQSSDNDAQFQVRITDSTGSILSHTATLTVTTPTSAQLNAAPTVISFGSVPVGASASRQITLAVSGNSEIVLTKIGVTGAGFNVSGVSTGLSQAPGQTTNIVATFAPASTGSVTGSITISSDASNPLTSIQLSGSGVVAASHLVTLEMGVPIPDNVIGYNVYRGTTHGGPYAKLTQSVTSDAVYTDTNVAGGDTYYYVSTSVDSNNVESPPSDEVSASIPLD